MAFTAPGLYSRAREMLPERVAAMLPEIFKFCIVGGLGTVIDLGGAAVLHSTYHFEPLAAKAVSVTLATIFTYLGSRFWTFKERENQSMRREAVLFIVLNVVGLIIAEAVIGLVTYVMGLRGPLEYNAASFIGTGLGTIFRFWAYRRWVFLDPASASAPMQPDRSPAFPDYPPWELDPSFLVQAEAAAQAPAAAPSYSSPWQREPASSSKQAPAPPSWGAPAPQPAPFPQSAATPYPAAPFPESSTAPYPTAPFPASPVPASPLAAPVQDMPWPTQPAASAPPAPSRPTGGRHRKS